MLTHLRKISFDSLNWINILWITKCSREWWDEYALEIRNNKEH